MVCRWFIWALWMIMVVTGCSAVPSPRGPTPEEQIEKLKTDHGILERALKRCQDQLPRSNSWPRLYSMGSFGSFWIDDPAAGKILELHIHRSGEEQLFIVSRSRKNEPVKLEGSGLRLVDAGVDAVIVYNPPATVEERSKLQKLVIEYDRTRFVILLKPTKY